VCLQDAFDPEARAENQAEQKNDTNGAQKRHIAIVT
jgi:hypothetical protein